MEQEEADEGAMVFSTLAMEKTGGVATVTFTLPDMLNAITEEA